MCPSVQSQEVEEDGIFSEVGDKVICGEGVGSGGWEV